MTDRTDAFRKVHVAALALAAVALPWSEFLLSISQFLLVGNWLVQGVALRDLSGRFKRAFTLPTGMLFLSFFALHIAGLLWTEDMAWGLDLCRILLPILAFTPVLASVPPISSKELRTVLLLGAWSAVASSLVCMALRYQVIGQGGYRELSIFISHIRLALLLCFSTAVFVMYAGGRGEKFLHALAIVWILFFLNRLSSLTGWSILVVLMLYGGWRWSADLSLKRRWALRLLLLLLPISALLYVRWCATQYQRVEPTDLAHLDLRSAGGEPYYHDLKAPLRENNHYVWINVADHELERAWKRSSALDYHGPDGKGQPVRHTLVHYLASLGVRKDSIGFVALSATDVHRVEQGIRSATSGRRDPIRARIEQVLYELERYRATGDANGHSVAMRMEFLKAGIVLAREHWMTGVGTGDTRPAFAEQYERVGSRLQEQWRLRAHNQYLTLWISFGVFGLLWSLVSWSAPVLARGTFRRPLFVCWAIIFLISCVVEDTIETQMGATFFALYYTLFVFATPPAYSATRPHGRG
jgi:hypothetical protein